MYRWIGALAALALVACGGPAAPGTPSAPSTPADLAALAEQFRLPDCPETDANAPAVDGGLPQTALSCLGSGRTVNLAGLPREPMIINFWAQWCEPCRAEAGFLREGLAELDVVRFVGVNYNDPQPDWAIEFAGLAGWFYPHVVDQDKTLRADLPITGIPTTIFVDENGVIRGTHPGPFESTAQLKDLAAAYLGAE
ncbi:MAG: TlpA family protein disulfide reductase [Tessaracoccus sp.]|uniref:TlpA family protein disulfide reductase n=1 Tax=Tessaracoccus sp. TaxID=1971211 RepID=UPI001EC98B6E|nr:TlpA disulfide reductase family protein [Tessaracoccus sp.]MBK7822544.1 TlpA family protein disulfide reductase [Tessaracoccus sp.]